MAIGKRQQAVDFDSEEEEHDYSSQEEQEQSACILCSNI